MSKLLRWIAVVACAVVLWLMASSVMFGLFLFVPLAVWIWGVLTPVQGDAKLLQNSPDQATADREFWDLILWNEEN